MSDAVPGAPATPATPRPRSALQQLLWAMLAVFVGVPIILFGWIGLVLLGDRLGWELTADGIFAWITAALIAFLLWPLAVHGSHRQLWHHRGAKPGQPVRWGEEPTAPAPKVELTVGERWTRVAVLVIGAASLLALCGPQPITLAVLHALDGASAGGRSWWLALQLGAFIVMFALLMPLLAYGERSLARFEQGDPERARREVVQHWYFAAVIGWVMSALVGLVIAELVLRYLHWV